MESCFENKGVGFGGHDAASKAFGMATLKQIDVTHQQRMGHPLRLAGKKKGQRRRGKSSPRNRVPTN